MTLNEFRIEKKWTFKRLAAALDCSTSRAWYLCRDVGDARQRTPDQSEMGRIIKLTAGKVTPNDFYDLPKRRAA